MIQSSPTLCEYLLQLLHSPGLAGCVEQRSKVGFGDLFIEQELWSCQEQAECSLRDLLCWLEQLWMPRKYL